MSIEASHAGTVLASESTLRFGSTPQALAGALFATPHEAIAQDAFLLSLPHGLRFHYRRGEGVTCTRPAEITDAEVALFLKGSVYGAIAWLNGFVPLHASAIVHQGRVFAFTGDSGAGKSTLAASLVQRGLPLFADDVLVLDLSRPDRVIGLPGHKQLKLWGDAVTLTGLARGEQVRAEMDKYFVTPTLSEQASPLPIDTLYFLDPPSGAAPSLTAISGADRFMRLRSAFYRPHYGAALMPVVEAFQRTARLASHIKLERFDRPRDQGCFAANIDYLAAAIRSGASQPQDRAA